MSKIKGFFFVTAIVFPQFVMAAETTQGLAQKPPVPEQLTYALENTVQNFQTLTEATIELSQVSQEICQKPDTYRPDNTELRENYHHVFDQWMGLSFLQFGPMEEGDWRYALAFWPDPRGKIPKSLRKFLLKTYNDRQNEGLPSAFKPDQYAQTSVAQRGLYALEYLLYDQNIQNLGDATLQCATIQAITGDMVRVATHLFDRWQRYKSTYPLNEHEGQQALTRAYFKSIATGLDQIIEIRLARPLGTFDRPRPRTVENWRSDRSLRNIQLSLQALREISWGISRDYPEIQDELYKSFENSLYGLSKIKLSLKEAVQEPNTRFKVEALQSSVESIKLIIDEKLGPRLGFSAGFNALDGDGL